MRKQRQFDFIWAMSFFLLTRKTTGRIVLFMNAATETRTVTKISQISAALCANSDALHAGSVSYEDFRAKQRALWIEAETDGIDRDVAVALKSQR